MGSRAKRYSSFVTFDEYAQEEGSAILNGEKLVAPEMVIDRLGISMEELRKFYRGRHPSGLLLPAHEFGPKTIRFRLKDVLWLEWITRTTTPNSAARRATTGATSV